MTRAEFIYYAKKRFALYPGVARPISGSRLADHYARRRARRSGARAALDAAIGLGFHLWVHVRAAGVARRFGKDRAWTRRARAISHTRFADPQDIALFRIDRAEQLDAYIRRFEDAGLNRLLNPDGWDRTCALVDKAAFYRRCETEGLPHPIVRAVVEGGVATRFDFPCDNPMIAKPSRGEGGRGVSVLPADLARSTNRVAFVAAFVAGPGDARQTWIVQDRVANHEALADYAMDALVSARMTTMRAPDGGHELVNAVLRMPSRRGPVIDNMKAGGLIAPLDLASGRAGRACQGYGGGDFDRHPVSGAALADLVLPDWNAAVELVQRAHAAFPTYRLIGWDVAFSPDGPMLLEGNAKPGVLMGQRSWRCGLLEGRYGKLLEWNLAEAEGGRLGK